MQAVNRDAVIGTVKDAGAALRSRGADHAALLGSVARDEAGPDRDIDTLIDRDPEVKRTEGLPPSLAVVAAEVEIDPTP